MEKRPEEQKNRDKNLRYMILIVLLFVVFAVSATVSEPLGMLLLGALIFYAILGNHDHAVELDPYRDFQTKREMLNYDKYVSPEENGTEEKSKIRLARHNLFIIGAMFIVLLVGARISMAFGMFMLGIIIVFMILASE